MRITQLNISQFGCFENKKIELDGGLNLIYGENESGKSTILSFIKFMLYGLTRRSATNFERERAISWSGHRAAGSMTLECGSKLYRIERSFSESGRSGSEKLAILCLDDGSTVTTELQPGEYFLGVPREVFEGSACVGQMRSADINGEKLASSIENMLSAADESVDTAKILKTLDSVRVTYRHKSKSGGSLYEEEQRINQLRLRAEKAKEDSLALDGWEQKLERAKSEYETVKKDYEHKDALLSELNKVSVLKRFGALEKTREKRAELDTKLADCEDRLTFEDFKVDRAHTAEIKLSAKAYDEAEKFLSRKYAQLEDKMARRCDEELVEIGRKVEFVGGAAFVIRDVDAAKQRFKKKKTAATVWAVLTAVFGVGAVGYAAFLAMFGATLSSMLPFYLLAPISLCFVVATVMSVVAALGKKRAKRVFINTADEYGATPETIEQKLRDAVAELVRFREITEENNRYADALEYAERDLADKKDALAALLRKTAKDATPDVESAAREYRRLEELIGERETMLSERDALERMISAEEQALSHYDEQDLREQISVNIEEVTPKAISESERMRGFLAEKLRILSNKISGIENTVISLRATAEDPLPISDELCELQARHEKNSRFYDALTLAIESIESASSSMRGNVTPAISRQASELLARLSGGRYDTLRTTGTLGVSLDKDGYSIKSELLSAGTRDVAYLSLRLALFMRIYEGELPPLVLDESLCQLDEKRAERTITLLGSLAGEGIQTILFTSHKREGEMCERVGAEHRMIALS